MAKRTYGTGDIPTMDGTEEFTLSSRAAASRLGSYWNALRSFKETGDASALRSFRGKTVGTTDGPKRLITQTELLRELDAAGELAPDRPIGSP